MKPGKFTHVIDNILGGHQTTTYGAQPGQFLDSVGIDFESPVNMTRTDMLRPGGVISPVRYNNETTNLSGAPYWILGNGFETRTYVYDDAGYVHIQNGLSFESGKTSAISGGAAGNGAAYYDNFMYFARNTDLARYGPLDGAVSGRSVTSAFWTTSFLGLTAMQNKALTQLTNTATGSKKIPNHILLPHIDNKLYVADVSASGDRAILNFVKTSKTTYQGDTNDGSTYNALDFPFEHYITDLESYGDDIAIALCQGTQGWTGTRAKLAFWDTVSDSFNQLIDFGFPDPVISALLNVNGTLYIFSGVGLQRGTRVSRYLGGFSFEQIAYLNSTFPPLPGAVYHIGNRIFVGGQQVFPLDGESTNSLDIGAVFSVGANDSRITNGVFAPVAVGTANTDSLVTAVGPQGAFFSGTRLVLPLTGWKNSSVSGAIACFEPSTTTADWFFMFRGPMQEIGQKFRIDEVRLTLTKAVTSNTPSISAYVYLDGLTSRVALDTINNTNFAGKRTILLRPRNPVFGLNDYFIELNCQDASTSTLHGSLLPITVQGEVLSDE